MGKKKEIPLIDKIKAIDGEKLKAAIIAELQELERIAPGDPIVEYNLTFSDGLISAVKKAKNI